MEGMKGMVWRALCAVDHETKTGKAYEREVDTPFGANS
jgi:hypothetical protein